MRGRYRAFLSYSHKDSAFASWLHRELERWRIDSDLVGKATGVGEVPRSLRPIFRDRDDFAGGASLKSATETALRESDFLVVICSPNAAASRYVNEEVRFFKSLGKADRIIPVILAGEPGDPSVECFPPAVLYELDESGAPTEKPAEPIAADAREEGDGRRQAAAKVAAGLLGLTFDEIAKRAERAQRRRTRIVSSVAATMACLALAALWLAWLADDRRREAQANYEAAKSAAGALLESVASDLAAIDEATLAIHRRVLARADEIYSRLHARAPDDLEVVASQARTLGIFAGSFRDRGDWAAVEAAAVRSEALLQELITEGENPERWADRLAAARMFRLAARHNLGLDDEPETIRLRGEVASHLAPLAAQDPGDVEGRALVIAASLQTALLLKDAGDVEGAALHLRPAIARALAWDEPAFRDGRPNPVGTGVVAALRLRAELCETAGLRDEAMATLLRLAGYLEENAMLDPDRSRSREQIAATWGRIELLAGEQGDAAAAARARRRRLLALNLVSPLRNAPIDDLRVEASQAFAAGEDSLALGRAAEAREWFELCAVIHEITLDVDGADAMDGYGAIRCLERVERTTSDAATRRAAVEISLAETAPIAEQFPELAETPALAWGRLAQTLVDLGAHAEAAAAFGMAGDTLAALLGDGPPDPRRLDAAAQSLAWQGANLRHVGEDPVPAYRKALALRERAFAEDPAAAPALAEVLERIAVHDGDRRRWLRIVELLEEAEPLAAEDEARLARARGRLKSQE